MRYPRYFLVLLQSFAKVLLTSFWDTVYKYIMHAYQLTECKDYQGAVLYQLQIYGAKQ